MGNWGYNPTYFSCPHVQLVVGAHRCLDFFHQQDSSPIYWIFPERVCQKCLHGFSGLELKNITAVEAELLMFFWFPVLVMFWLVNLPPPLMKRPYYKPFKSGNVPRSAGGGVDSTFTGILNPLGPKLFSAM